MADTEKRMLDLARRIGKDFAFITGTHEASGVSLEFIPREQFEKGLARIALLVLEEAQVRVGCDHPGVDDWERCTACDADSERKRTPEEVMAAVEQRLEET